MNRWPTPRAALALLLLAVAALAGAQPYPSRPLDIVVPYAPGGTTDFVTRVIAQKMTDDWKQPVVVLNKPGASGQLGADYAAAAAGDGYTLLITGYVNRNLLFAPVPPAPNPPRTRSRSRWSRRRRCCSWCRPTSRRSRSRT